MEIKVRNKHMNRTVFWAALVVPFFLISGCMTATRFQIENGTGRDVTVKSYHTQETVPIPAWGRGNLYHTNGDISISSGESNLLYKNMSPLRFRNTQWLDNNRSFLKPILTMYLYLTPDGYLYASPKRKDFSNIQEAQPKGYPLKPIELDFGHQEYQQCNGPHERTTYNSGWLNLRRNPLDV